MNHEILDLGELDHMPSARIEWAQIPYRPPCLGKVRHKAEGFAGPCQTRDPDRDHSFGMDIASFLSGRLERAVLSALPAAAAQG